MGSQTTQNKLFFANRETRETTSRNGTSRKSKIKMTGSDQADTLYSEISINNDQDQRMHQTMAPKSLNRRIFNYADNSKMKSKDRHQNS